MASKFDHSKIKVWPLSSRKSLSELSKILVDPETPPPDCPVSIINAIRDCADQIGKARSAGASVIMIYGAHLIKNGLMDLVVRMLKAGWITHLATNGAGVIHDWELSFLGRTEESVRANVATGCFGTWDETGKYIHLALMVGALEGLGFGQSVGKFIAEDGATVPEPKELEGMIKSQPSNPRVGAWSDLLQAVRAGLIAPGRIAVSHPWKDHSVLYNAWKCGVPLTVHPGIGYDIFTNHPIFNGAVIGRAAGVDFDLLAGSIDRLDGGVVISVGTAVMGPQVFEKAISCVNNVRLQEGKSIVSNHSIYVVDIQDGGGWDWSAGEPTKDNPAYYLRFCKSYARTAPRMIYIQCSNNVFLHHLWWCLKSLDARRGNTERSSV